MKLSNLRLSLSLTVLFLSLLGCATTANKGDLGSKQFTNGIFWKIEKSGVKPSYVFGTIHSEDKRVINLPPKTEATFKRTNTFAMEMVLDDATSKEILTGMYFTNGKTIKPILSDKTYKKVILEMAKRDLPERIVNMMKPWAIFTVLNMPEQETGQFLDAILYQSALSQNKKVVGLETAQEQLAVFDEMSIETQISLLESTLESGEDFTKMLDETIDIYLTQDLKKMQDLNARFVALLDKDIAEEFNRRLILDRNKRMFRRMKPLIEEGNAFIAVGALHLPGEKGVLSLLKQDGYLVSVEP